MVKTRSKRKEFTFLYILSKFEGVVKMGEYVCPKCNATLDPGETCRCEYHSAVAKKTKKENPRRETVRFEVRDGKMYAVVR